MKRIDENAGLRHGQDHPPEDDASSDATPGRFAVCVFCGAKPGDDAQWAALARDTGAYIARQGWTLVYGGGRVGLMGAVADGALEAGGDVIGVIPERLVELETAHEGCTRLEVVPDMAVRKTRMVALSDAFVSLPGGMGTLDELFEVLTLSQLAYHDKPILLVNHDGFWDALVAWGDHAVSRGFLSAHDWARLVRVSDLDAMVQALRPTAQSRPDPA